MKAGKIVGYVFSTIGLIFFMVALFYGLSDMFGFETAMLLSSSNDPQSLILSLFFIAMAHWIILATVSLIIGILGFYFGRNRQPEKILCNSKSLNERLETLEKIVEENSSALSKRLDALKEKNDD